MRVLVIKMSSLGDVVHTLPAVSDAVAEGAEIHWLVEEAYVPIVERHEGVREVLPIAWRRWRSSLGAHLGSLRDFVSSLRSRRYDVVIDAQGLIKSAVVTSLARAPVKAGFDFSSAREGVAAAAYNRRFQIAREQHAVDRLRTLFGAALGYDVEDRDPAFYPATAYPAAPSPGAEEARSGQRQAILLHGTTWPSKHLPLIIWRALAERLAGAGWQILLPWGNPEERLRAEEMAVGIKDCQVMPGVSLRELTGTVATSDLVIGVDSGLTHLAAALGIPTVGIYGSTSAALTGCRGNRAAALSSDLACAPCLTRECGYRGEPLIWQGEVVRPACYARVTPDRIWEQAMTLLDEQPSGA